MPIFPSAAVRPRIALSFIFAACSAGMLPAQSVSDITIAVLNARIWTGNSTQPWAEAVAVGGERILAVGSNEDIRKIVRPATRVIEGNGATVTPGFIDAHFHLLNLENPEDLLNMRFVSGRREFADHVARAAAHAAEGTWILGEGWDERKWGGDLPSKEWIDQVSPRNPVWLTRALGSAGLANSLALRAAGVTAGTREPPAGGIVRDARGEPTGLIRGGPMWLIDAVFAERDQAAVDRLLEKNMEALAGIGVTSIHHTGNWQELLAFQRMRNAGRLGVRIYAGVPLPGWERLRDYVAAHGRGDSWLHWGSLKLFRMEWSSGPRIFKDGKLDRYSVQPGADEAYEMFAGASRAGLQIMVHAGGYPVLQFYQRIRQESNQPDLRHRIEHAHDVPSDWISLYAKAGVIASVQPPLLSHFDSRARAAAPPATHLFPCRELLEAGVKIVFGTDALTASPLTSPLESIQMALERAGPDGRRMTLEECLRAYTRDAAYAEFAENEKGSIEPGKLADLVLLDRDIFAAEVTTLHRTRVRLTILNGRIVAPSVAAAPDRCDSPHGDRRVAGGIGQYIRFRTATASN